MKEDNHEPEMHAAGVGWFATSGRVCVAHGLGMGAKTLQTG